MTGSLFHRPLAIWVELCLPGELDKRRGKWSFQNLPIIPEEFELKPIAKTETRFKLLQRLMKRDDVDLIVNACDAGREGELIFRYLIRLAGVHKPLQRLWLQSMTFDRFDLHLNICAAIEK